MGIEIVVEAKNRHRPSDIRCKALLILNIHRQMPLEE